MKTPVPPPNLYDNTAENWCAGLDMEKTQMAVVRAWKASQIVAIASDTQVVLTCEATDTVAIAELRQRTQLPTAPLTLLYQDLFRLAEDTEVDAADMLVLQARDGSSLRLTWQSDPWTDLDWSSLVPGLTRIPVAMAPGSFYQGLLEQLDGPIAVLVVLDSNAADFVLDMPDEDWPVLISRCLEHSPLRQRSIVHTTTTAPAYSTFESRLESLLEDAAVLPAQSPTLLVCWDERVDKPAYWTCQEEVLQPLSTVFAAPADLLQEVARRCYPRREWTYEHEAAALLEAAAHRYFREAQPQQQLSWLSSAALPTDWPSKLLEQVAAGLAAGLTLNYLSARLFISIADALGQIAKTEGYQSLALTGDYFRNAWLVDLLDLFWGKSLKLHYHQSLSPANRLP
jgi:hydrogenase maturation factor HypF (carbamoyltransferase family)